MNIKHLMAATAAAILAGWAGMSAAADATSTPPSAKAIRGASTYVELENEPPPKLFVDPPLAEGLAIGVVWLLMTLTTVPAGNWTLPLVGRLKLLLSVEG